MATGATILVVDDDEQILGLMKALLRQHDFNPVTASSCDRALDFFDGNGPDLILLDLGVPGMKGPDLVNRLRRSGRDVPVIVVSGREPSDEELRQIRAAAVVPKPFEIVDLIGAIRRALEPVVC